jgi:hypothetical protein
VRPEGEVMLLQFERESNELPPPGGRKTRAHARCRVGGGRRGIPGVRIGVELGACEGYAAPGPILPPSFQASRDRPPTSSADACSLAGAYP